MFDSIAYCDCVFCSELMLLVTIPPTKGEEEVVEVMVADEEMTEDVTVMVVVEEDVTGMAVEEEVTDTEEETVTEEAVETGMAVAGTAAEDEEVDPVKEDIVIKCCCYMPSI